MTAATGGAFHPVAAVTFGPHVAGRRSSLGRCRVSNGSQRAAPGQPLASPEELPRGAASGASRTLRLRFSLSAAPGGVRGR